MPPPGTLKGWRANLTGEGPMVRGQELHSVADMEFMQPWPGRWGRSAVPCASRVECRGCSRRIAPAHHAHQAPPEVACRRNSRRIAPVWSSDETRAAVACRGSSRRIAPIAEKVLHGQVVECRGISRRIDLLGRLRVPLAVGRGAGPWPPRLSVSCPPGNPSQIPAVLVPFPPAGAIAAHTRPAAVAGASRVLRRVSGEVIHQGAIP